MPRFFSPKPRPRRRWAGPSLEGLESRRLLARSVATAAVVHVAATPTVTVADEVVSEGAKGKVTKVLSQVTLSSAATKPTYVYYKTSGASATSTGKLRQFVAARGVIVIRKGQETGSIRTLVIGNPKVLSDTVYNVQITSARNATLAANAAGALPSSRVVIRNTETSGLTRPTLSVSGPTVVQGSTASFVFTLSQASSSNVSVRYATEDGTSAAGTGYTAEAGILTIPAGQTSETITVPTASGALASGSSTFTLQLDAASNADLAATSATATINATSAQSTPALTVAGGSVIVGTAGTSTIAFTVSLSAASSSAVTVHYATADGTALAGTDYATTSGTLTFAPGTTTQTVAVTVNGESTTATTKALSLNLSSPSNATIAAASASAAGTINYIASGSVVDLSDNLTQASGGRDAAAGSNYLAAEFTTPAETFTLNGVTLMLAEAATGTATVAIYSDAGLKPGSLVATLASPSSYSTSLASTTFTASGVSLAASTSYWVVLIANTGTFDWSWTKSDSGTGSAFTTTSAESSDSGATWYTFNSAPPRLDINATATS